MVVFCLARAARVVDKLPCLGHNAPACSRIRPPAHSTQGAGIIPCTRQPQRPRHFLVIKHQPLAPFVRFLGQPVIHQKHPCMRDEKNAPLYFMFPRTFVELTETQGLYTEAFPVWGVFLYRHRQRPRHARQQMPGCRGISQNSLKDTRSDLLICRQGGNSICSCSVHFRK